MPPQIQHGHGRTLRPPPLTQHAAKQKTPRSWAVQRRATQWFALGGCIVPNVRHILSNFAAQPKISSRWQPQAIS